MLRRYLPLLLIAACAPEKEEIPAVAPFAETVPVASSDDAADDPAIWINPEDAGESLILGTDKRAGLYVYDLSGAVVSFLPAGKLNNVDLRQDVEIGEWRGDIAAASNRTDDSVTLFTITDGVVEESGGFPSLLPEPYGLCMGVASGEAMVFVAYKTGDLVAYRLTGPDAGEVATQFKLTSQLEGCVFDEQAQALYVGEEARGVWRADYAGGSFVHPEPVAEISSENGMKADVEGVALYKTGESSGFLVVSSQGNNSYALFDREDGNAFIGRFEIADHGDIDGAQETDGLEAVSVPLGAQFPRGVLVVQDGFNDPKGSAQNFKIVDWREIETALADEE